MAAKLMTQIKYLSQTNTPPSERRGGKKQRGGKAARDEKSIILKKQKCKNLLYSSTGLDAVSILNLPKLIGVVHEAPYPSSDTATDAKILFFEEGLTFHRQRYLPAHLLSCRSRILAKITVLSMKKWQCHRVKKCHLDHVY
ncbi:hypothetical protein pdam_00000516 [Pocillopora damicornis]|uniref:Uncharacterized protein n=1 Tax=Pocillopora damicornis TaxID=46731 RepID=A0A3M6TXZ3_POCDA|nr:hypothetical protein pdam_00000516 [Pocillopora damicornis]